MMPELYLIWSNEHRAWWAPNECGYRKDWREAGLYTHDAAVRICADANSHLSPNQAPHETMIAVSALPPTRAAVAARLADRVAEQRNPQGAA